MAYSATFNFNPTRGQHEQDVYYVRVSPTGGVRLLQHLPLRPRQRRQRQLRLRQLDPYGYRYLYAHSNSNSNSDGNSNGNGYRYTDCNSYCYS